METWAIIMISLFGLSCIANIVGAIWNYRYYRDKNHRGYGNVCIMSACVYGFFCNSIWYTFLNIVLI